MVHADVETIDFDAGGTPLGYFVGGAVEIGAKSSTSHAVVSETEYAGLRRINLITPVSQTPEIGAPIRVYWGCNGKFDVCTGRFDNAMNFRGFPHMPTTLRVKLP